MVDLQYHSSFFTKNIIYRKKITYMRIKKIILKKKTTMTPVPHSDKDNKYIIKMKKVTMTLVA